MLLWYFVAATGKITYTRTCVITLKWNSRSLSPEHRFRAWWQFQLEHHWSEKLNHTFLLTLWVRKEHSPKSPSKAQSLCQCRYQAVPSATCYSSICSTPERCDSSVLRERRPGAGVGPAVLTGFCLLFWDGPCTLGEGVWYKYNNTHCWVLHCQLFFSLCQLWISALTTIHCIKNIPW